MNKRTAIRIANLVHEIEDLLKKEQAIGAHIEGGSGRPSYIHIGHRGSIAPLLTNDTIKVRSVDAEPNYPWPWEVSVSHDGVMFLSLLSAEDVLTLGLELPQSAQDEPSPES